MVHLVTGGSSKSEYAENMLCRYQREKKEQLIYIATMLPYGDETKQKIERHRQMRRGKGFEKNLGLRNENELWQLENQYLSHFLNCCLKRLFVENGVYQV